MCSDKNSQQQGGGGRAGNQAGYGAGYGSQNTASRSAFTLHRHPDADAMIKGLVIGAGVAYLLTNEKAQRFLMRGAVKLWSKVQGGVAEVKERFHDAEAEAQGDK